MIKTETKEINGRTWQCTQWAGSKNLVMMHRIFSIVSSTAAHGIAPGQSLALDAKINFGSAVDALLARIGTAEEFTGLVRSILSQTHCDGESLLDQAAFDRAFVGPRVLDLIPVIRFVLETNYGDFSKAAGGIINLFAAVAPSNPTPPEGSTND